MKRIFDITVSFFALIFLFPFFLIVALIVLLTSKGPILYWSNRVGKDNSIFKMPKFRTMKINTPTVATHLLLNPDRYLTKPGSFLRKTSLDELPQLWSIFIGDMSFVGPRPALFNQVDLIKLRTEYGISSLTPGLTGWAQINGRDELSIQDKVDYEYEYLRKRSFFFDIKILRMTLLKVLDGSGIMH